MNRCHIGIIGGGGRMGKWFRRFFETAGHTVWSVEDKEIQNMRQVAQNSDVVVISVPIRETCKVIERLGPYVKAESLLMDLSSLKAEPVTSMLKYSRSEVIGTHPLFGPDAESLQGQTVILCAARADKWLPWLTEILSAHGARLEFTSPEIHDRLMAIVQAMGHISTIVMGLMLKELDQDLTLLERHSTPLFRLQMGIIGRLFHQNPRLYAEMITQNPEVKQPLAMYCSLLDKIKRWVDEGQSEDLVKVLADASPFFDPAKADSLTMGEALIKTVTQET